MLVEKKKEAFLLSSAKWSHFVIWCRAVPNFSSRQGKNNNNKKQLVEKTSCFGVSTLTVTQGLNSMGMKHQVGQENTLPFDNADYGWCN